MAAAWNFARTCIIQQIMILKKVAPRVVIPIEIAYISKFQKSKESQVKLSVEDVIN